MIKNVLIFAGGALTGAALCYLYLHKRYEKRVEDETRKIIEAYEEMLNEKNERIKMADEELSRGVSSTEVLEKAKKTLDEGKDIPSDPSDFTLKDACEVTKKIINYSSFSRDGVKFDPETFHDKSSIKEPEPRDDLMSVPVTDVETMYQHMEDIMRKNLHPMDSDEDEEVVLSTEEEDYIQGYDLSSTHARDRSDKPKLIKYEDYGEDSTLTQATLLYFVDNDILTTEDEEEVDDPTALVGNCLDKFGFKTNDDEKTIFVRNSKLGFDYEIIKVFESYSPRDTVI